MAQIASHLVVNQPYAERLHKNSNNNNNNNNFASNKNNQTSYIRTSDKMSGSKASTHFDLNDNKHSYESVKNLTA